MLQQWKVALTTAHNIARAEILNECNLLEFVDSCSSSKLFYRVPECFTAQWGLEKLQLFHMSSLRWQISRGTRCYLDECLKYKLVFCSLEEFISMYNCIFFLIGCDAYCDKDVLFNITLIKFRFRLSFLGSSPAVYQWIIKKQGFKSKHA